MKEKHFRSMDPAVRRLVKQDPVLEKLFEKPRDIVISLTDDYFRMLVNAIVSQQLSGRVAAVIYERVENLLDRTMTPEAVIAASFDDLRACGLSSRKIDYIQSLAHLVHTGSVHFNGIEDMTNEEIIDMLVQIKGIGPWTAEMFLLFSLGREDVFSVLDLGLRTAMNRLYQREMSKEEMLEISKKWIPYRSYVSHFLWHYLED